jgi:hypothetical protein
VDDNITGKRREVMRWWIERLPLLYLSPSLLSSSYYLSPFFHSFLLTASLPLFSQSSSSLLLLPHSSPSTSSLPLSLVPLSHPLPSFLCHPLSYKEDGDGRKTEVMRWMIILQEREER